MALPDLTSVDRVKEYLRTNVGEHGTSVLRDFVGTASRLIRRYTGRRFTSPRILETRVFRPYGMGTVHIDEVFSTDDITAVVDENGVEVLYDLDFGTDPQPYGVDMQPQSLATRFGITGLPEQHCDNFIRELRGPYVNSLPEKISVTATFGYGEDTEGNPLIPPDIEFAARRAVAIWWKEEVAHYTDDAFISRGRIFLPEELPPIVIATLRGIRANNEVAV